MWRTLVDAKIRRRQSGPKPEVPMEMYCRSAKQCQRLHEEVIPSNSSAGGAVVEGESKSGRVSCLISCERGEPAFSSELITAEPLIGGLSCDYAGCVPQGDHCDHWWPQGDLSDGCGRAPYFSLE